MKYIGYIFVFIVLGGLFISLAYENHDLKKEYGKSTLAFAKLFKDFEKCRGDIKIGIKSLTDCANELELEIQRADKCEEKIKSQKIILKNKIELNERRVEASIRKQKIKNKYTKEEK